MFNLQHELNILIGKDTINASKELRDSWLFGYAFALQQEFGELYDCLLHSPNVDLRIFDFENAKVETLDATHFILSVFHILNISPEEVFTDFFKNNMNLIHPVSDNLSMMFLLEQQIQQQRDAFNPDRAVQLNQVVLRAWRKTDELLNTTSWKWWSVGVKSSPDTQFKQVYFPEKAKQAALDIFKLIIRICCILDMTAEDVLAIYKMKHAKNCKRQDDGYDVRFKTEADNEEIHHSISIMEKVPVSSINFSTTVTCDEKTGLVEVAPGQFKPLNMTGCNLDMEVLSEQLPEVKDNIIHGYFGNRK